MFLNETYSKVHVGKYLSDSFPIKHGLKQEDALSLLPGGTEMKWDTSASGFR
jgi:hypothetical protein